MPFRSVSSLRTIIFKNDRFEKRSYLKPIVFKNNCLKTTIKKTIVSFLIFSIVFKMKRSFFKKMKTLTSLTIDREVNETSFIQNKVIVTFSQTETRVKISLTQLFPFRSFRPVLKWCHIYNFGLLLNSNHQLLYLLTSCSIQFCFVGILCKQKIWKSFL